MLERALTLLKLLRLRREVSKTQRFSQCMYEPYLQQRGGEHDGERSHELVLALLLNLEAEQKEKPGVKYSVTSGVRIFSFRPLTSLVFLMICCRRMREFSGSLFTSSSRLQRFIDCPAEHISTGRPHVESY